MKKQDREQKEIHQLFNLFPKGAIQGGVTADHEAASDQDEVGQEQ
jgi:hypothetical protein